MIYIKTNSSKLTLFSVDVAQKVPRANLLLLFFLITKPPHKRTLKQHTVATFHRHPSKVERAD
jgi:hypothetical protein